MFNLQLANTYSPTKNYGVSNWYASPKLDGVRCCYIPGQGLMSRSGKLKYVGLEHIENVCAAMVAGSDRIIDGELYITGETFDKISGIVRDTKNYDVAQKQRVQFHVFAFYSPTFSYPATDIMIESMNEDVPDTQSFVVKVPYSYIDNTPVAIQAYNQQVKDSGLSNEGIILRHPDITYHLGRSHHLLKVKNFYKGEFTVIGFAKGTGKYSKSLGKLLIEGTVQNKAIAAKVGTGFTDAERQEIWDNQANYLGEICEVVYLSTTVAGSLRLPTFSKFT